MKHPAIILTTVLSLLIHPALDAAPPRLLPFQGRLTDANGVPVADGAKVVQFKIYDAPTGGNAVWPGEVQKLTVNGGLVSTLLGSKADLSGVDFNQALYLEISIDANADGQITQTDPPLLPRQSILPAVFAVEAQSARDANKLAGSDWSAVFDNGNPASGKLKPGIIGNGSIPAGAISSNKSIVASQLATSAVGAPELADNAVDNTALQDNAITSVKIADGEVKMADLAGAVDGSGAETIPGAVTTEKIKNGTILNADLSGAVDAQGLETTPGAVTSEKIKDGTVRGRDLADLFGGQFEESVGFQVGTNNVWQTVVNETNTSGVLLFVRAASGSVSEVKIWVDDVLWRHYTGLLDKTGVTPPVGSSPISGPERLWIWEDDTSDYNTRSVDLMPFKRFNKSLKVEMNNLSSGHETAVRVNYLKY